MDPPIQTEYFLSGGAMILIFMVEGEAKMDPPIQTEYFLSGGAMILIFMVEGAKAVISFCIRSAIPGYMVVPPERTVLAYKSFLISMSHFMIELKDLYANTVLSGDGVGVQILSDIDVALHDR